MQNKTLYLRWIRSEKPCILGTLEGVSAKTTLTIRLQEREHDEKLEREEKEKMKARKAKKRVAQKRKETREKRKLNLDRRQDDEFEESREDSESPSCSGVDDDSRDERTSNARWNPTAGKIWMWGQ